MSAAQILTDAGYKGSVITNENNGKTLVKVRTTKGWTYERFTTARIEDELTVWLRGKEPAQWS